MALSYKINPVSGDSTATIWADASMTKKIGELPAGSMLTVTGSSDKGFVIKNNGNAGIATFASTPSTGTVKSNSGLNVRSGPGTSNSRVGALNNGAKVTITEEKDSWYKVSGSSGWGTMTGWVSSQYIVTDGGGQEAFVSKTDVQVSGSNGNTGGGTNYGGTYASELADTQLGTVHFTNYSYNPNSGDNTAFYKELISKITYALGCPPKYNMDIDIQYESDVGMGRVMLNTFYSSPTLLSICPGKVKMFPNLFGQKKDTMLEALIAAAAGNGSLVSKLQGDTNAHFSGKMYTFQSDTAGYAKRLNLLCRACAILLGIGDKTMPGTNKPLKSFDYAYWTIRKAYAPTAPGADTSIFNDFWNAGMDAVSGAVTDKNYIHFVLSNNDTSISETMSTDVTENQLMQTLKSTVNGATSTLTYFLNSGFNEQTQDLSDVLSSALDGVVGGENGWTKLAKNLMKGGQMAFPKQISSVNFAQAVQCNLTFISPYGSPYAIFLYCIVPIMHILAMALPKQVADNMYTFPFICRVCQKGWFNSNLACVGDVQINRGGQDNTSWTHEGLATEWNVSFSIIPLYEELMVTSTDNPFLFIKNEGLVDYLGNLCAFDLKANNLSDKIKIFTSFVQNKFTGIPNDAQRWISDMLAGKISGIFQF